MGKPRISLVMPERLHAEFAQVLYRKGLTKKGDISRSICAGVELWLKAQEVAQ